VVIRRAQSNIVHYELSKDMSAVCDVGLGYHTMGRTCATPPAAHHVIIFYLVCVN
jgi:hypothetical protein